MICEGTTQLALNGYRLWCFTLSFVTTQKFYSAELHSNSSQFSLTQYFNTCFQTKLNVIGQFQLGWEMLNSALQICEIKDRKNRDFGRPPFTHICGMLFFHFGCLFFCLFSKSVRFCVWLWLKLLASLPDCLAPSPCANALLWKLPTQTRKIGSQQVGAGRGEKT